MVMLDDIDFHDCEILRLQLDGETLSCGFENAILIETDEFVDVDVVFRNVRNLTANDERTSGNLLRPSKCPGGVLRLRKRDTDYWLSVNWGGMPEPPYEYSGTAFIFECDTPPDIHVRPAIDPPE